MHSPGDILYFAGDLSRVEFCGLRHGLRLVTSENEEPGAVSLFVLVVCKLYVLDLSVSICFCVLVLVHGLSQCPACK